MSRLINNIENLVTVAINGGLGAGHSPKHAIPAVLYFLSHENYSETGQTDYIFSRKEFIT